MSKIKILPENISNRIAAGEVIERPASVVKELVENSIDAGASAITVRVEKSGIKSISVSDDGSGMDRDDALLCLEPHATSKIITENDIDRIVTFGFRGEALPSIASVSRLVLKTRKHDSQEGSEVIVHGGKFISSGPAGCAPGTEFLVKDLFFNTPARKKFLRAQATEERHIQETFCLLALPYPSVSFELIMDEQRVFSSPSHGELKSRIRNFFGREMEDGLMPLEFTGSGIKVSGYIARHGFTKNSRREQRIFVNGRAVEAFPVYTGIREGYHGLVEKGRFPPVILFLSIDPSMIDVNVHPAKRELRFRHEHLVISVISEAVRTALRTSSTPASSFRGNFPVKSLLEGAELNYRPAEEAPSLNFPREDFETTEQSPSSFPCADEEKYVQRIETQSEKPLRYSAPESEQVKLPGSGNLRIIGFLDKTYILAASDAGLLVIDQHAAHERVLYERLLRQSASGDIPSQRLLFPVTLELSRPEILFIGKNKNLFEKIGFEIESFGQNTIIINSIPLTLKQDNVAGLISDLLSKLMEDGELKKEADTDVIAKAACTAAVKAQDSITLEEAKGLIKQMAQCELPFSCPHGRPTVINISVKELEKRFSRK